ncbi:hypothetical protein C0993_006635 [Termitomyces sp. T159_Od127]|nr:hypothetical protein C0993_006635 [Termitomyces sp. T159_Od127]
MHNLLLPPQDYLETYYLSWPQPPAAPPIHTPPSPLGHQQVEAYIQQRNKVLCLLCISLAEFAKYTCTLLVSLEHHYLSETLKQWDDCLLKFHKLYQHGAISENVWNMLQVDLNLWDELHALVDEIYTSSNPWHFEDPMDPAHLFYVQ